LFHHDDLVSLIDQKKRTLTAHCFALLYLAPAGVFGHFCLAVLPEHLRGF
jgi:hypothetical protein